MQKFEMVGMSRNGKPFGTCWKLMPGIYIGIKGKRTKKKVKKKRSRYSLFFFMIYDTTSGHVKPVHKKKS